MFSADLQVMSKPSVHPDLKMLSLLKMDTFFKNDNIEKYHLDRFVCFIDLTCRPVIVTMLLCILFFCCHFLFPVYLCAFQALRSYCLPVISQISHAAFVMTSPSLPPCFSVKWHSDEFVWDSVY